MIFLVGGKCLEIFVGIYLFALSQKELAKMLQSKATLKTFMKTLF